MYFNVPSIRKHWILVNISLDFGYQHVQSTHVSVAVTLVKPTVLCFGQLISVPNMSSLIHALNQTHFTFTITVFKRSLKSTAQKLQSKQSKGTSSSVRRWSLLCSANNPVGFGKWTMHWISGSYPTAHFDYLFGHKMEPCTTFKTLKRWKQTKR